MIFSKSCLFVLFSAFLLTANADTEEVNLGTAGDYAILTKAGISTVPPSIITGDIAVSPIAGTAMTGFGLTSADVGKASESTQVSGFAYAASYIAPTPAHLTTAVGDMGIAYTDAAGRANTMEMNIGGGEIGSLTLAPGVYTFGTNVGITTDVTLTGSDTDIFIIRTTGDLALAANVKVTLTGGALAKNIFWQVAGKVVVGAGSTMQGIVLVKTGVTFITGSNLKGRVLAQTACVLQQATITEPTRRAQNNVATC